MNTMKLERLFNISPYNIIMQTIETKISRDTIYIYTFHLNYPNIHQDVV